MPTSTTHALVGSLVGAAMVAEFKSIHWGLVVSSFAKPLLLSPVLAVAAAAVLYLALHRLRVRTGISAESCVCVGQSAWQPATGDVAAVASMPAITVGTADFCAQRYTGAVAGVQAQAAVNFVHYLSGGAVCFARALNDTPKIAGLVIVIGGSMVTWKIGLIAAAMAIGGLVGSRRVAMTMSKGITRELNTGQGLTASLVTAALVLGASNMGVPVSTTHVSCGSIFGMGLVNGNRNWKVITQIAATWLTTLPLGLALGALIHWLIRLGA
jgi:PiT family inorganic phosphate transporter